MHRKTLYRLDTEYGCGGVVVSQGGLIVETCPLYRWMMGKPFRTILSSLKRTKKLYGCDKILDEYDTF